MERRKFLKSLLVTGLTLSPISTLLKSRIGPNEWEENAIGSDAAFELEPYVIMIQNSSQKTAFNIDIFGSCEYLNTPGFVNGKFIRRDGIEISSLTPGISYEQLLWELLRCPVYIEKMVIETSDPREILDPLSIIRKSTDSTQYHSFVHPAQFITPYYDRPYDSVCVENSFLLERDTKINLGKVNPCAKKVIRLYPVTKLESLQYKI